MIRSIGALLLFSSVLLAGPPLGATVGDNQETLYQRYGKGKQVGGNALLYKLDQKATGISVTIYFEGNYSSMEIFSRGHDPKGDRIPLTEEDIQLILEANNGGHRWQPYQGKRSRRKLWRRSDGTILASYNEDEAALTMMAPNTSIGKNVLPKGKRE